MPRTSARSASVAGRTWSASDAIRPQAYRAGTTETAGAAMAPAVRGIVLAAAVQLPAIDLQVVIGDPEHVMARARQVASRGSGVLDALDRHPEVRASAVAEL